MRSSHRFDTPVADSEHATMYVAFELGKAKWLAGIVSPGSAKLSRHVLPGGDTAAVWHHIARAHGRAVKRLGKPVCIVSCYEAGYDGFWLHRWLEAQGVESRVLDPASIEVNRRARRAKTDRLDLEQLMRVLIRHEGGERRVCSVVRPPSVEQEDTRRPWRERERLVKERTMHVNRIKGLLHGQGVRALQPHLVSEITREHVRLTLVEQQIGAIEAQAEATRQAAVPNGVANKINQLIELKSLGPATSQTLVGEAFFRDFQNRRQVGAHFGLTGTPFDSGNSHHEQGISKAGNPRAHTAAIELAWLW